MKLGDKIKAIGKITAKVLGTPKSLFKVLEDESNFERRLMKSYNRKGFRSVDINFFLKNRSAEVKHYAFLEGGSLLTDLALLKSIASGFEACDYLEIGTWRGESIVNVADIPNSYCTSINLSPEQIIAMGLPEKYAYEHAVLIKDRDNINEIHADSQTFNFTSLGKKFDLIFIDGDHSYKAVKSDTENIFQLLKDDNSVIVWHDYGFDPVTPRYSVIAAILDGLPEGEHKNLYHVSNTMCAVYTRSKEIRSHIVDENHTLNKIFSVKLENFPFEK